MRKSNELQIGKAGEYIVCADAIMKGLIAYPTEQGLPYDVIIDTGSKMLRCQVKTTERPRTVPQRTVPIPAYTFNVKRHGVKNSKRYSKQEVDIFALVELETKSVAYVRNEEMPATLNIRVDSFKGQYRDERGVIQHSQIIPMLGSHTMTAIAEKTGIHIAQVSRMAKPGFKPFKTSARYFSDFKRDKEWFYGV